jgi:glycosylphosphatidylinositol transamidase (GPIT) subunit GPI8
VANFIAVLTGRGGKQKRPVLTSDENSNVLIYMTGHGGDQFFKFQDHEEIMANQIAETLQQMHVSKMYKEILLVADTCQAFTLSDGIVKRQIPNVIVVGSSLRGQSSYAHSSDRTLGLSVIEKYTHFFVQHVRNNPENQTMQEQTLYEAMVQPFTRSKLSSEVGATDVCSSRKLDEIPLRDFFANVQSERFWSTEEIAGARDKEQIDMGNGNVTLIQSSSDPSLQLSYFNLKADRIKIEEATMQCSADKQSPSCSSEYSWITSPSNVVAMEPTDVKFLLVIASLLAIVIGASVRW